MKNEMNAMKLSDEARMHALLCAYVLGELDGDERAEIDAALAGSESLRAEKARIEATVGVVSSALQAGAGEALSPQSTAALEAAVARHARVAWYRSPWLRAAASVVFVATLATVIVAIEISRRNRGSTAIDGLATAKVDAPAASAASVPAAPAEPAEQKAPAVEDSVAQSITPATAADSSAVAAGAPEVPKDAAAEPSHVAGDGITGADIARLDETLLQNAVEAGRTGDEKTAAAVQAPAEPAPTASDPSAFAARFAARTSRNGEITDEIDPANEPGIYNVDPSALSTAPSPTGGTPIGVGELIHYGQLGTGAPSVVVARRAGGRGKAGSFPAAPGSGAPGPSSPGPSGPGATPLPPPARGNYLGVGDPAPAPTELGESEGLAWLGVDGSDEAVRDGVTGADFDEERKRVVTGADEFFLGQGERAGDDRFKNALDLRRYKLLEQSCRYRPNERPRDMFFRFWGDNPFELAALDKLSTFSVDVDTASYALARSYLVKGHLPTKEQIRTEEFINYFKGDVPPPLEGTFNVAIELAPSLFGDPRDSGSGDTWMLRVALRGREVKKHERMPLALTLVVDVSGSMREGNRLELVKHALRMLSAQLDARDTLSLVTFSDNANLVLPATSAKNKDLIESAVHPLQPQNSTNTEAGLRMGYAQAAASLTQGANNRVVLLTDGVANVGITNPNALVEMVESQRRQGILLNTVGVGMDNHNDNLLEQLADKGDGLCNYVDDEQEVRRALVDNFTGAFEVIARDVKIQVEFDPAQVERYRLLGYENRAVADADFRNDKVDAGEIGAGHQVVALYEIVRRGAANPDGPLATAHVRYKDPYRQGVADRLEETPAHEFDRSISARQAVGAHVQASAGYRRSVIVAQFAEFLRRSVHARSDSLDRLIEEAARLAAVMGDPEFDEFVSMVRKSRDLVLAELRRRDWFDDCSDLVRHNCYLRQQLDDLRHRLGEERQLDELERQMRELERRLAELRRRMESAEHQLDPDLIPRLQQENIELQRKLIELCDKLRAK